MVPWSTVTWMWSCVVKQSMGQKRWPAGIWTSSVIIIMNVSVSTESIWSKSGSVVLPVVVSWIIRIVWIGLVIIRMVTRGVGITWRITRRWIMIWNGPICKARVGWWCTRRRTTNWIKRWIFLKRFKNWRFYHVTHMTVGCALVWRLYGCYC